MSRTLLSALFVATIITPAFAQAPEDVPNTGETFDRGSQMATDGERYQRNGEDLVRKGEDGLETRRGGVDLQHKGVIQRERALDAERDASEEDAILRAAHRRAK